jgi:hypothetical protein
MRVTQKVYSSRQTAKALRENVNKSLPRQKRYAEQERKLAGRSSYSKTDGDATDMRMKEDRGAEKPLPRPAYNVQPERKGSLWWASACISEPGASAQAGHLKYSYPT